MIIVSESRPIHLKTYYIAISNGYKTLEDHILE